MKNYVPLAPPTVRGTTCRLRRTRSGALQCRWLEGAEFSSPFNWRKDKQFEWCTVKVEKNSDPSSLRCSIFVKLPSGRGEHDQMENRERSTSCSRSGVVGQGSLDHHVGRGGKFPILTNGSRISIAPMIDWSAACAAAGCSVEQEDEEEEEEAEVENFQDVEAEAEREELKRFLKRQQTVDDGRIANYDAVRVDKSDRHHHFETNDKRATKYSIVVEYVDSK
ncbi:hypothetical protein T01_12283 [Trichinella spiralis]|uniref:Uncharacterized protein n=1 Tax=Trichinella spiralis TaxID=6334 RepID=A0A0V1BAH2_TRISP|nr:hypothetical protein T01_12283 [Trichinella spiralis]